MNAEQIQNYLDKDFSSQVNFYDKNAKKAKGMYRFLSIYIIIVSALLTPLVALITDNLYLRIFSALLAATIVIASGLLSHLQSHENWLSYRATWDSLTRERRFYDTRSGIYKNAKDPDRLFIEQVEAIFTREGVDFYSRSAKVESKPDDMIQFNK